MVEIRTRDDVLPHVQYFLIGDVWDASNEDAEEEADAEEEEDAEERDDAEGGEDVGTSQKIPTGQRHIRTLRRFFWKCRPDAAQAPIVVQVPAWHLGKHRFCEMDDESTVDMASAFPEDFDWKKTHKLLMEFEEAESFQDLVGAFVDQRDNGKPKLAPYRFARNSRLTYTIWDLSLDTPDVPRFPKSIEEGISIDVRFVQHLEPINNSRFTFIQNKRYDLVEDSDYSQVKKTIVEALQNMQGAQAFFNHSHRFERDWDLQLWVQAQDKVNMFKLTPGRLLRHFFDQNLLDQMNLGLYLEAHIVPRGPEQAESIPTDQPIDEVLDVAGDGQLHIRLTYDVRGLKQLISMNGTSQVLHLRKDRPFQTIFKDLAKFVASKLESDQLEYHTELKEKRICMLMMPILDHPCPIKRRAFDFDDSGIARVATIGDLVSDAIPTDGTVATNVKPQLSIRLRNIENLIREAPTDPVVVIRPGALKKDIGGLSQFYRIGSVPKKRLKDHKIAKADTFFWRSLPVTQKPTLMKSDTWTVRKFDICNPDEGKHVVERQYNDVLPNLNDSKEMVQNGSILPFLRGRLLYSFKTFGEKLCCPEPVDAVPSSGLSVALRFISHIKTDGTSKISFDHNSELTLEFDDTYETIEKEIMGGLDENKHGVTKALFKEPLVNSWCMQLWILPQVPDGTTLYRYSAKTELHCFLNKPDLDKGDTTLFMEVHLLPKPLKPVVTQSDARGLRVAERANSNRN
jgi:hypothetical protein